MRLSNHPASQGWQWIVARAPMSGAVEVSKYVTPCLRAWLHQDAAASLTHTARYDGQKCGEGESGDFRTFSGANQNSCEGRSPMTRTRHPGRGDCLDVSRERETNRAAHARL